MSERVCVICRFTEDEIKAIEKNVGLESSAEAVEAFMRKNMTRLGIENCSTTKSDAIENGETEEVHAMWDADWPNVKSDSAAEIIEDIFRREGRNVGAEFMRTENGEPVFAITDLPAGQTAAVLRASRDEDKKAIATPAARTTDPNTGSARTDANNASANGRAGNAPAAAFTFHTNTEGSPQMKTEVEEISAEWNWRDGDPTTPEAAQTFAARIKAATDRDVRATYLRNDGDNGVVFAIRDIDRDAEAERKERAIAAYRETFAEAAAAGITNATPPDAIEYTFAANVADEADEIENATRALREEIGDAADRRDWEKARKAADDADAARIMEHGAKKSQAAHDRTINALRRELEQTKRERDAARKAIVDGIS